jgi:uncharacterized membrane protein YedE/YeeE
MALILSGQPPIHWALAGSAISAITLALLLVANRRLGVSSGFEDICSLVLSTPYLRRPTVIGHRNWRLPLLAGLLLGGFLSAALGRGWSPTWALGMFDRVIGLGPSGKIGWMFAGGLLVGFGTRLANGCTSGHGIFGLSNFELPSLVATVSFMTAGVVTSQLVYHVIFR